MAPWTSRILSPKSRRDSSGQAGTGQIGIDGIAISPARRQPAGQLTEADILNNAYGIPSLPFASERTHTRSLSHPFPSLFSGKKSAGGRKNKDAGAESEDDGQPSSSGLGRPPPQHAVEKHKRVPDGELTTGKCVTCDSLVRWPKELKVFRCTVCLTINDLVPVVLQARRGDGHRAPVASKLGANNSYSIPQNSEPPIRIVGQSLFDAKSTIANQILVAPLSVEKTSRLIDQCITAYLSKRLRHEEEGSPAESPAVKDEEIKRSHSPNEYNSEDPKALELFAQNGPISPIHLTEYPIEQRNGAYAGRSAPSDRTQSVPYSTSSPGNFFSSHMEQRDRKQRSGNVGGKELNQGGYFDYKGGSGGVGHEPRGQHDRGDLVKSIFRPIEDYIVTSFASFESINSSFSSTRPTVIPRATSEQIRKPAASCISTKVAGTDEYISELDAKTLLLGDIGENGFWWTGEHSKIRSPEKSRVNNFGDTSDSAVSIKSPRISWPDMNDWYALATKPAALWRRRLEELLASETRLVKAQRPTALELEIIEEEMLEAQTHTQRVLLKATETLLKRPGRPLREPEDLRFLLIILSNPLLYPSSATVVEANHSSRSKSPQKRIPRSPGIFPPERRKSQSPARGSKGTSGQNSGIIKRILGLLSNVPNDCHHHIVSWFARYSDTQFQKTADLVGSFVTYRLTRQHGKKQIVFHDPSAGLIPNMTDGRNSSAALHAALGAVHGQQASKKSEPKQQPVIYNDDWQIKAAARVMALLFSANNSGIARRGEVKSLAKLDAAHSSGLAARERAHSHGQIVPTSDFYNTLLDYSDLVADFEAWESRRGKFAFCQYPFFLSIWAKIQIMEHDARRQMEVKAREAWFDSIMTHKNVNQYLVLKIRRDCLVEDSLKGVSEVVGSGGEEIKKGLRIEFKGEEGIDAGGLRKEWFLLLVRDVFNPEHGMFSYDEDSQFCYFNPNSFETTDQYFLVGVVLGLAIYNSTILDVALPPFAFRKLLAAGPAAAPGATSHAKPSMTYSLEDLAEYRPSLASGLRQLLEFEGDVEATFCRDFVADVDRYGQVIQVPLCQDGEKKPVTNSNRREFVDLYVRYLLDTAVTRQFEPFKRGFFTVCGGNALSLFRPEEIELLIRGSDEPLDIASLRAVAVYEHWGVAKGLAEREPVVEWFWNTFQSASAKDQRKLLSFITGSDRIPAMGATNLIIKLSCLGPDGTRFPVARTCFNTLSLYRYSSRRKLETMLWRAVNESEGFGLK